MTRLRALRWSGVALACGIAGLAAIASAVASSSPDGLERVAADLGFEHHATTLYEAPMPDYDGTGAGLVGTALVGALAWGSGRLLARRR